MGERGFNDYDTAIV